MNAFLYQLIVSYVFNSPRSYQGAIIILPFWLMSLVLLRMNKVELAGYPMIFHMHLLNTLTGVNNLPFIGFYGLVVSPALGFLLIKSLKLRLMSITSIWCQYIFHVNKLLVMFKVTFTEEQGRQILLLFCFSTIIMAFLCLIFLAQKSIEENIWKIAEEQYQKSEKLTQDIQAKDVFVSSLSHEVRNPLNSMSGSIEYLLQVIKNPAQQEVLESAKLSGEILLNILNNALDAAKLKAEKMELSYSAANFSEVLKKVMMINSKNLAKNGLFARVFIDKSLPKILWIDPFRILQIMMNLMSNAIKFTKKDGKIHIKVSWCDESTSKDTLLSPSKYHKSQIPKQMLHKVSKRSNNLNLPHGGSSFGPLLQEVQAATISTYDEHERAS